MCETELQRVALRVPLRVVPRATTVPGPGSATCEAMITERRVYEECMEPSFKAPLIAVGTAAGASGRDATTI